MARFKDCLADVRRKQEDVDLSVEAPLLEAVEDGFRDGWSGLRLGEELDEGLDGLFVAVISTMASAFLDMGSGFLWTHAAGAFSGLLEIPFHHSGTNSTVL